MLAALDESTALALARCLYWAMPVAIAQWVVAALVHRRAARCARDRRSGTFRGRHGVGLGVALGVTLVALLWASPPQMRMQFDETSLCGTAQGMHLERAAVMGQAAAPGPGGPVLLETRLDKRPPLFSFLVSVLHDLTGYRVANAFVVNAILLFVLLAFVASVARNWLGAGAAVVAPLLLAAVPLLLVAGTSAGFELLATLLGAVFVVAAIEYVAAPSPGRFSWMLANGVLFALARYESVFVAGLVFALVWWRVRRIAPGGFGKLQLATLPVFLVPMAMLLWHSWDPAFYPEANGRDPVSVGNGLAHLGPFVSAWFLPLFDNPFPGVLGIVSIVAWVTWLAQGRGTLADVLVVLPVLAWTAVVLLWFFGDVTEPTALRLYLPSAVLGALGVLTLLAIAPSRSGTLAVGVGLGALLLAVPRLVALHDGDILPEFKTARVLRQLDEQVLANVSPDPARTVWVTTVAQYMIVHGDAAVTPAKYAAYEARFGDADVLVLTTPLDEALQPMGDPRAVLRTRPATLLGTADYPDSDTKFEVWQLRR